jgi:hypothetical protein
MCSFLCRKELETKDHASIYRREHHLTLPKTLIISKPSHVTLFNIRKALTKMTETICRFCEETYTDTIHSFSIVLCDKSILLNIKMIVILTKDKLYSDYILFENLSEINHYVCSLIRAEDMTTLKNLKHRAEQSTYDNFCEYIKNSLDDALIDSLLFEFPVENSIYFDYKKMNSKVCLELTKENIIDTIEMMRQALRCCVPVFEHNSRELCSGRTNEIMWDDFKNSVYESSINVTQQLAHIYFYLIELMTIDPSNLDLFNEKIKFALHNISKLEEKEKPKFQYARHIPLIAQYICFYFKD